ITLGTVAATVLLAWLIPKGFFPQQDTGLIIGVSEAPADVSFPAMMDRQRALADVIRQDPDVATVASFIGADGTNPTLNTGRFSIALKSRKQRSSSAEEVIARLQDATADVAGITLYLQSVQDLQVESKVSRTQFQLTLEDADPT